MVTLQGFLLLASTFAQLSFSKFTVDLFFDKDCDDFAVTVDVTLDDTDNMHLPDDILGAVWTEAKDDTSPSARWYTNVREKAEDDALSVENPNLGWCYGRYEGGWLSVFALSPLSGTSVPASVPFELDGAAGPTGVV